MSGDLEEGLSWIMVDPRVTSRGISSSQECLSLSVRLWPDVGATNEIKTLALFSSSPENVVSNQPASVKIYVEEGSNLGRISFANVIKSSSVDLIKRGPPWMAGRANGKPKDIEVNHGKSQIGTQVISDLGSKVMWMMFLFPFRACE